MDPARIDQVICVDNLPPLPLIEVDEVRAMASNGRQDQARKRFEMSKYIGDRGLYLDLSLILLLRYGYISEGSQSELSTAYTNNTVLASLGWLYHLNTHAIGPAEGCRSDKPLNRHSDAFEAYMGRCNSEIGIHGTSSAYQFLDQLFNPAVFPHMDALVGMWQARVAGKPLRLGPCPALPNGKQYYYQDTRCDRRICSGRVIKVMREADNRVPLSDYRYHGM